MFITILLDIWREKMKFITKKYRVRLAVFSLVCCVCICGTMYAPPPGYAMGSDKKDENSFDWNDLGADVLGTGLGYLLVK